MSHFTQTSFTSTDGLRLYTRDYAPNDGAARLPVICIHGLTRNSADFEDLAPWVASQGRRVLAVDVRGRGNSEYDPDPSHYNPVVYAGDIIKMARDLGIARAVFIGTSMGGLITMTLALRRLGLISAAVLNDVGPAISVRGLQRIAGYVGQGAPFKGWEEAAEYARSINQVAFPHYTQADWAIWARRACAELEPGKIAMRYDPNIALAVKTGKIKPSSLVARYAFRRLARKRPTLLLHGSLSDLVEAEQVALMRKIAPGLTVAQVPGVGHAPMLDEPVARTALKDFLARID